MKKNRTVHGILLLYHHYWAKNAPTIMENINSFSKYSKFKVWSVNTEKGFPSGLNRFEFDIIVLHYSLFGSYYLLNRAFLEYIERSKSSYKIVFFQDEYHYCQQRFAFLNKYNIDCVYTLLHPDYFKDVYLKYTNVRKLVHTLTGYVDDALIENAKRFSKPDHAKNIDIGYRGRPLKYYMGKGSQEKHEIAKHFSEHAKGLGLMLDLESTEKARFYGDKWYKFLGDQKACLGTEAGVSIFDVEDVVRNEYERLIAENPSMTFEEMSERFLKRWEGNIPHRVISPRIFEAAAFRICQILYEGEYQGILQPMIDYIPLKKDFSNFDDVIKLFRDTQFRQQITENCYRDLIASGKYSYRKFIEGFDRELMAEGFSPEHPQHEKADRMVSIALTWYKPSNVFPRYLLFFINQYLILGVFCRIFLYSKFGEKYIKPRLKPLLEPLYERLYRKFQKLLSIHWDA